MIEAGAERRVRRGCALRSLAAASALAFLGCGAAAPVAPTPPASHPIEPARVLPDRVDAGPLLAPIAGRAAAAGAGPMLLLGAEYASEGERVGAFVAIPEAACLVVFARGTPAIGDVDLVAFDDEGSVFGSDESPEAGASMLICPPHPRRLYIAARVMAGAGLVGVGAAELPRAAADAVAKAVDVRSRAGQDTGRLDGWPGLEAKIRAHREALGGRWEDIRRVAAPVSPRVETRMSAPIEAGRCLDVLVAPAEEVSSLEVLIEDAAGRILARARDIGRDRAVVVCSSVATEIGISLRPRASQGLVAVTLGRSSAGAAAELTDRAKVVHVTPSVELEVARRALDRALAGSAWGSLKSIPGGAARPAVRRTVALDLPAGCARVDVVGGSPLAGIRAALWDDHGGALAEATSGASAVLFTCGKGGPSRVDVEALESAGPFAIERRSASSAPAALLAHPIAASRLLARLEAEGDPADPAAAGAAIEVALDGASSKSGPLAIPANGCIEVVAAIDAGGDGVDLRLIDAASGEGPITRGVRVATDRICAGALPKVGSYELRLASGKASALVLVRAVRGP